MFHQILLFSKILTRWASTITAPRAYLHRTPWRERCWRKAPTWVAASTSSSSPPPTASSVEGVWHGYTQPFQDASRKALDWRSFGNSSQSQFSSAILVMQLKYGSGKKRFTSRNREREETWLPPKAVSSLHLFTNVVCFYSFLPINPSQILQPSHYNFGSPFLVPRYDGEELVTLFFVSNEANYWLGLNKSFSPLGVISSSIMFQSLYSFWCILSLQTLSRVFLQHYLAVLSDWYMVSAFDVHMAGI